MKELSSLLLERGLVAPEKLQASHLEQTVTKESLGKILVRNGFLRQDILFRLLQELDPNALHDEAVYQSVLPAEILIETRTMIVATIEETIYLATLSSPASVRACLAPFIGGYKLSFTAANPLKVVEYLRNLRDASQNKEMTWEKVFHEAMRTRSSDIHVLPRHNSYTVMYRRDGVLTLEHEGTLDEYIGLVTRVKDLAKMDMAEKRRTQDGSFTMPYSGRMVTFRVSTLPVVNGEKMVVRILDPDSVNMHLGQLGITRVDQWRSAVAKSDGLCLICGPTGSGKTTTLSCTVREMNFLERAIYTAEEPVEHQIAYTSQTNVNNNVGLDFATAVRAFMRADPDVIIVGEVRDLETARNALKASETGHLTIATLHTQSIIGAIGRLRDIGVQPYELRHLLRGVMVQRLMRVYCSDCHGGGVVRGNSGHDEVCPLCKGAGYKGREVVSEVAEFRTEEDVDAVIKGQISWPTILQDAKGKVLAGRTSEEELWRVFGVRMDEIPDYVEGGYSF